VRSGSTLSNSVGTLHIAISVSTYEKFNNSNSDYDVALLEFCIAFNVSIDNEMCITYCCGNQLYLTLLLSQIFQF